MKVFVFLFVFISSVHASTGSCWNVVQTAELAYEELKDGIKFSFKDAKSCEPVSNAQVYFAGQEFTTDMFGELTVPIPPDDFDAMLPLVVKADDYVTLKQKVRASVGSFWQNKFLMVKGMPIKSAMFVLAWGDKPKDLDLHLVSDDFHISFRNKNGASYKAKIDRDSMNGYGPETITLGKLDKTKPYKVYVHRYSLSGKIDQNVNFSLYKNNKIDKVVTMPNNLKSSCVQIATILNNKVTYDIKDVSESKCK